MVTKKRGLGRGWTHYCPRKILVAQKRSLEEVCERFRLRIFAQVNTNQKSFREESLEELRASIVSQGLVQPIVLRQIGKGDYEIISGERRWRASKLAGLETVPAIVKEASDESVLAMSLIENIQREDLNPLEEPMQCNVS